jgi:hypothetical protein
MRKSWVLLVIVAGVGLVAAGFMHWMHAPSSSTSRSAAACVIRPAPVSVTEAKQSLSFAVYSLSGDADATLLTSQYAQGCSGVKGLDLEYKVQGDVLELIEYPAPPAGTPLVKTKFGWPAPGWSTTTIAGHELDIDTSPGGKGMPGGIEEAVWESSSTIFTMTPHAGVDGGAPSPLTADVVADVVQHLTEA